MEKRIEQKETESNGAKLFEHEPVIYATNNFLLKKASPVELVAQKAGIQRIDVEALAVDH